MYQKKFITTPRLTTAYHRAGEGNSRKLLLVHGNVSSSAFFLPLFPALSEHLDVVAVDLRCFGDTDPLPIDATRGYRDWTEDLAEFTAALGWERFAIAGWSMGGAIAMQYTIDYARQLTDVILINPGSPFGFGGTKGETGELLDPPGLASGGGCVSDQVVQLYKNGDREPLRASMNNVNFTPAFQLAPEWEELFLDERLKVKIGDGMYPGDSRKSDKWPFVVAGDKGVCNTMSPSHGNLAGLADIPVKPPILWVRGASDIMVSDNSICEFGFLGKSGMIPGWPGEDAVPPQPMVAQTRYVLEKYAANGGTYREVVHPGSHGSFLESADAFIAAVLEQLSDPTSPCKPRSPSI